MKEELDRIETAVRHDQKQVVLQLLASVRGEAGAHAHRGRPDPLG